MNHEKVYNLIIQKAKSENRIKYNGAYYENHHIIPRCVSDINSKENLALLTAKEHYICHELLTYIYPKNRNLAVALMRMSGYKTKYKVSSRDYARAKENLSNTSISEETRTKLSLAGKKRNHSDESKNKIRESKLGNKNPIYGRSSPNRGRLQPCKEETKNKLSDVAKKIAKIKCEYCYKLSSPGNYAKWHGEKCKLNSNNMT
jgi:hypothetical protein